MNERKKINWLLILQGWAMLWVVIGHSSLLNGMDNPAIVNTLHRFAYSFHMQLFLLVSGLLFYVTRLNIKELNGGGYKWRYVSIIKDKALRLLLPGLVFSVIAFAVKLAFPGETSRHVGFSFQEVVHSYLYPYDNPLRELWFIATLFWLFLLTPFWRLTLSKERVTWITLVVLIALHFWHPQTELLCIDRVFEYAIWFYLGLMISRQRIVEKFFARNTWITMCTGGAYMHWG